MQIRTNEIRFAIFIAATMIAAFAFGQKVDSANVFTPAEFNLLAKYVQSGMIPILTDSMTMIAAMSMRSKVDSVVIKKMPLARLQFTATEKNIIAYLITRDLGDAMALIRLKQKITLPMTNVVAHKEAKKKK